MPPKSRRESNDTTQEITLEAIQQLLDKQKEEIIASLHHEISELRNTIMIQKETICALQRDNEVFRSTILQQAINNEKRERLMNQEYAVIHGINGDEWTEKLKDHLNNINARIDTSFKPIKIGKNSSVNRNIIKIKFNSATDKFQAIKDNQSYSKTTKSKIFITSDLPLMTRFENARLRKAKRDLEESNPNLNVVISKAILMVNKVKKDEFNLKNQVFRL